MANQDVSVSDSFIASGSTLGSKRTTASTSEGVVVSSSSIAGVSLSVSVSEMVSASGASGAGRLVDLLVKEGVVASDSQTLKQILTVFVSEGMRMSIQLSYQGVKYDGWVVNANNYAGSRYEGFNFNSFAEYQGKYYGCGDAGIHSLDAPDDKGSPIESFVGTGFIRPFGMSMSRVMDAYLLMKNDGDMAITVVCDGVPYTYPVEVYNDVISPNRVKVGKAAKAVVWRFEVKNLEGSDFDIDSFKIYPIELTRHR